MSEKKKKRNPFLKVLKVIFIVLLVLIVLIAGLVVFLSVTEYRPAEKADLVIKR